LAGGVFFRAVLFGGRGRLGIVLFVAAAQDFPAARAVQGHLVVVIVQIVIATAARAFYLERLVAAHDTVAILDLVAAESGANGAALGDVHRA
jgi:hypothetical protein